MRPPPKRRPLTQEEHERKMMDMLHDPKSKAANKLNAIKENRAFIAKAKADKARADALAEKRQGKQPMMPSASANIPANQHESGPSNHRMHITAQVIDTCTTIISKLDCDTFYVRMLSDAFVIITYRMHLSPRAYPFPKEGYTWSQDWKTYLRDDLHRMAPKRPDVLKKQERVKKILDEPAV